MDRAKRFIKNMPCEEQNKEYKNLTGGVIRYSGFNMTLIMPDPAEEK